MFDTHLPYPDLATFFGSILLLTPPHSLGSADLLDDIRLNISPNLAQIRPGLTIFLGPRAISSPSTLLTVRTCVAC